MSAAPTPRLHALGDAALLCELPAPATLAQQQQIWALGSEALQWRGVHEVLPGMNNLTLLFDPAQVDAVELEMQVLSAWPQLAALSIDGRLIEIPVAYGGEAGPDLQDVASHTGLSAAEVVRRHAAGDYVVYLLGFLPGFAFMGGLPPELATPRRAEPRTAVPARSVGIGGEQTGVYPLVSPGGWQLIGRTSLAMFDPDAAEPTLLRPGDRVRFRRRERRRVSSASTASLTILRPGMLASVQDLGRYGHRQRGICPGGALDALALTVANRLVGNPDDAAGIEITLGACEIRFESATRIALAGDDFGARLDGVPVWPQWSFPVAAGQVLRLSGANEWTAKEGLRTWLAVAGGIDVQPVLGSRSTDLKAGFGGFKGRALKKNDVLPLGSPALSVEQRARRAFGVRAFDGDTAGSAERSSRSGDSAVPTVLRVMPGPECEQFTVASRDLLWRESWRITAQSNRMGSRLQGAELKRKRSVDMLSSGVIPGTIQVPPSGQPIILMGDAQTTGGYPRIGVVIRADLWKLARAPLNGRLRLVEVDAAAALAALGAQKHYLAQVAQGLASAGWPVPSQNAVEGELHAD